MKNYKNILFIIISSLLLVACKKDKLYPNPSTDDDTVWEDTLKCEKYSSDSMYIYSHAWGRYQYRKPFFNPNNSNEFIYSYRDFETNTQQLIKFNIQTKQKLILADLGVFKQPKWNKNGWIAFSNMHHLHVIKEDGSDYRQISTQGQNTFPFWHGNVLYWRNSITNGLFQLKQDLNQLKSDTLSSSFGLYYSEVINEKLLTWFSSTAGSPKYYGFFNLNSQASFTENDFEIITECPVGINGLTWDPSGTFFYSSVGYQDNGIDGLYRITLSGQEEKIMDYCESKWYSNISCSADGKYIIGERTASHLEKYEPWSGRLIQNSTIWLINTETMEETKINLE